MTSGEEASQVLRHVKFSYYSPEELRTMSVKRITSPIVQDSLGKNVRNGLYDPALGPTEKSDMCETCGENYVMCPGHFGHIDLVMPVYNPLPYKTLYKIMRNACLFCHHFRIERKRVEDFIRDYTAVLKDCVSENDTKTAENQQPLSMTSQQFIRTNKTIDEFLSFGSKPQCTNCRAQCHAIKSEGHGKMFLQPLSSKKKKDAALIASTKAKKKSKKEVDDLAAATTRSTDDIYFREPKILLPVEVKEHVQLLWEKESEVCDLFWGGQGSKKKLKNGSEVFFLERLAVTPSRFRPPNRVNDQLMEHPQNVLYGKVINANLELSDYIASGEDNAEKGLKLWLALQNAVNELIDSATAGKDRSGGIRQLLEKKEGLFRMGMMGKRVNFCCRSVISPDPYIGVNEMGIPPNFATKLTYPEKVTPWNCEKLRACVENGPFVHPGATHVVDENGVKIGLEHIKPHQRRALAKTLLSTPSTTGDNSESGNVGKTVYRHMQDGDILLVNRQPTLHKPGVMGHKARIIKGQRALRMHYANCSTYNADFDGDEMNVHFPQDEVARAEAYEIVNANQQFIVPTSGEPIRGLIQDHIVSSTLLTKRDTCFTKEEYQHLVFAACAPMPSARNSRGNAVVNIIEDEPMMETVAPAILKPKQLWTGKQVITAILNYITRGRPPFSCERGVRLSADYIGKNSEELKVIVQDNELICGIIDKAQFGKYGMVHHVQELYGADDAGHLLSVFSRLFSNYLQMHGFTCGIGDLLLRPDAEKERRDKLKGAAGDLGDIVHARFVGMNDDPSRIDIEAVKDRTGKFLQMRGDAGRAKLDMLMSGAMNGVTSNVNNALFPAGLLKPFPHNSMCAMTGTGAKGSPVNFTQMSMELGQQELEGKRVPRMISGKTLPCFQPYEPVGRAGGFIADRFVTGLKPQEYYFHCMAGRDGLVDTAVKTAKSGYLQRCIVKNIECLMIHYDYTVRDSDGSVVQFFYGEDGVDVTKSSCLDNFGLLSKNRDLVAQKLGLGDSADNMVDVVHEGAYVKEIPRGLKDKFENFLQKLLRNEKKLLKLGRKKAVNDFRALLKHKYFSSLAAPGEPVGVLAGQSVGEPSTQMTLNTFHFAGRGEMNVTLGIPRLLEILMSASKKMRTPIMTCPLASGKTRSDGEFLAAKLKKVLLADILESINISIVPFHVSKGSASKVYKVTLRLYPAERFPSELDLKQGEIETAIKDTFAKRVQKAIDKETKMLTQLNSKSAIQVMTVDEVDKTVDESSEEGSSKKRKKKSKAFGEATDNDDDDDDDNESDEEEGADAEKRRGQRSDEATYESDSEDEDGRKKKDLDMDGEEEDEDEGEDMVIDGAETEDEGEVFDGDVEFKSRKSGSKYELRFSTPQDSPQLFLPNIIEKVLKGLTIRRVNKIEKCAVIDLKGDASKPALQTDGVNFEGLWRLGEDLDMKNLMSNDIFAVLETYGVEAARATIVSEVQAVFGSYGIAVNVRHLGLIADFMTNQGTYRGLNRIGIAANPSPFLKMSYETATRFLIEASLRRQDDTLTTPSSRIITGRPVELGTGSFDILQNVGL